MTGLQDFFMNNINFISKDAAKLQLKINGLAASYRKSIGTYIEFSELVEIRLEVVDEPVF